MKEYFTTSELIANAGLDPTTRLNPVVTKYISDQLVYKGYSQKIMRTHGKLERLWGKNWKRNTNRSVKKKPLDKDVFQRLDSVIDLLP